MTKTKTPAELSAIRRKAGRAGGQATRDRHGSEFFSQIGKVGRALQLSGQPHASSDLPSQDTQPQEKGADCDGLPQSANPSDDESG